MNFTSLLIIILFMAALPSLALAVLILDCLKSEKDYKRKKEKNYEDAS